MEGPLKLVNRVLHLWEIFLYYFLGNFYIYCFVLFLTLIICMLELLEGFCWVFNIYLLFSITVVFLVFVVLLAGGGLYNFIF